MSRRFRKQYGCPVELAVDVLGGKWKTVILARIKEGPLSYGGLRKAIPGLSDKVLSDKLRDLIELGVIEHGGAPSDRKVYALSRRGRDLAPALEALYHAGTQLSPDLGVSFAPLSPGHDSN
ncbi:winged helix-turn-helix transcriptional regulator [Allosphingosinicella deserti]|uniref:Transcriptional regulator n=1 Tax=Allosphingosinicella deserti TaxID=2116704 RepID=A0A2P7QYX5_9SPHN|nr:helix-turn-helix domain-containing protein [Sphingomonas deserti]PSJ43171.1 transcriptional regulator [Sphingomonas deserti]